MRSTFDCRNLARSADFPESAKLVPFRSGVTVRIKDDLFASYVAIGTDEFCPNGVFEYSSAVDVTEERSRMRALFEAIERYCLAAIGWHESRMLTAAGVSPDAVFRHPIGMAHPPFQSSLQGARLLPCDVFACGGTKYRFVNAGDVFAPYPMLTMHCSYFPTTNGVAVGRTTPDATEAAQRELIERHSIMMFWYTDARMEATRIELETVLRGHPAFGFLTELGYRPIAFEISLVPDLFVVLLFFCSKGWTLSIRSLFCRCL